MSQLSSPLGLCVRPSRASSDAAEDHARTFVTQRRGIIAVLGAFLLASILAFLALAIDVGWIRLTRTQLQTAADAATLAAVMDLPDQTAVLSLAQGYASNNHPNHGQIVANSDVFMGNWDFQTRTFSTGMEPINAVWVTARRSDANGNALRLFFARALGKNLQDVSATAIAVRKYAGTRFLVDDEMIDTDVPAIENLATALGKTSDELLSDADGDWFIDLPPGKILELPTGQVGDEALFDINHTAYPFSATSSPSHADFLNYNEDSSSWRYGLVPKGMLDALVGVSTVSDGNLYPSYVDGYFVHVSPVYKSDISALNPVGGAPAVNALGLRRGLLAFKVIGIGSDPDGPGGSVLPNLIIEIVEPTSVSLDEVQLSSNAGNIHLVK